MTKDLKSLPEIRIGNVTSSPGTKKSGRLKIAEKAASSIELPVTVIQGSSPGPTLAVLAGDMVVNIVVLWQLSGLFEMSLQNKSRAHS